MDHFPFLYSIYAISSLIFRDLYFLKINCTICNVNYKFYLLGINNSSYLAIIYHRMTSLFKAYEPNQRSTSMDMLEYLVREIYILYSLHTLCLGQICIFCLLALFFLFLYFYLPFLHFYFVPFCRTAAG